MGLLGSIIKFGMDVATSPISVVSDVFTMGGAATESESEIKKKFEQLAEDWEEIKEKVSE